MPELESQLEAFFRKRVRLSRGYTIKLAPIEAGIPDRLVMFPRGRMYLVELKTETGRLSAIQKHWHHNIATLTGVTVYTLKGRGEVLAWLREAAKGDPTTGRHTDGAH